MKGFICASSLVLAMSAGVGAYAGDATDGGDNERLAREHMHQGLAKAAADDLRGALIEYRAAYDLRPKTTTIYNIAQVERALGEPLNALEHYRRFLREAAEHPADVDLAVGVRNAGDAIAALLSSEIAIIEIDAAPGTLVVLDARSRGAMPLDQPIEVLPGGHVVTLRRGTLEKRHELTIAGGQHARVDGLDMGIAPDLAPPMATGNAEVGTPGPFPTVNRSLSPQTPATIRSARPFYQRWYFWSAVAAVALVGGGLALYETLPREDPCPTNPGVVGCVHLH